MHRLQVSPALPWAGGHCYARGSIRADCCSGHWAGTTCSVLYVRTVHQAESFNAFISFHEFYEWQPQVRPEVAGLPTRIIAIRDQNLVAGTSGSVINSNLPAFDVSVNYVPITNPQYRPARIAMTPGATEFWRVINAGADTILNLQVHKRQHTSTFCSHICAWLSPLHPYVY